MTFVCVLLGGVAEWSEADASTDSEYLDRELRIPFLTFIIHCSGDIYDDGWIEIATVNANGARSTTF